MRCLTQGDQEQTEELFMIVRGIRYTEICANLLYSTVRLDNPFPSYSHLIAEYDLFLTFRTLTQFVINNEDRLQNTSLWHSIPMKE